jgi:hypothetical protein
MIEAEPLIADVGEHRRVAAEPRTKGADPRGADDSSC